MGAYIIAQNKVNLYNILRPILNISGKSNLSNGLRGQEKSEYIVSALKGQLFLNMFSFFFFLKFVCQWQPAWRTRWSHHGNWMKDTPGSYIAMKRFLEFSTRPQGL